MIAFLFSQYKGYETIDIVLEIIAILFGLASVLLAKKNNILVYPTGIVSTIIFVYLLHKWGLVGDMLINGYYTTIFGQEKLMTNPNFRFQELLRKKFIMVSLFF